MDGRNLIGFNYSALTETVMEAFSPALKRTLEGQFHVATPAEVEQAMELASQAFVTYRETTGVQRAAFLRAIADEIMNLGDRLIKRASEESALPEGRITGERGRTVNQLRLFAKVVEEGSWVEARIDRAQPERKPLPKADIRRLLIPLGPVVVFTASNFPLAFSTAGGDTASALASGCPVVVKAHESHLGTNALIAYAIQQAAMKTGMPDGVFSSLNGTGQELGQQLVKHPKAKAIAFTGSLKAGRAIFDSAAQRAIPIPVYAEMGSINPVVLLEDALQKRGAEMAEQYAGSVTLGVGQFCTNPGLLIGVDSPALTTFIQKLAEAITTKAPGTMLNSGIGKNFAKHKTAAFAEKGVQLEGQAPASDDTLQANAAVASVSAADFIQNSNLQEEVFGPFTLVVKCQDEAERQAVVESLGGQLTATVMGEKEEIANSKALLASLADRVGRLILNGLPTGVEVCDSMHHGGPYPATTDARSTSVGTAAIQRFARPIALQNYASELLPAALQDENPLGISRMIDGEWGKH